ncbi:MAG: hypothetical protein KIT68_12370 [Phycisphaeraceae bacterium]|nr:hypothetical protein [Phycisphaeraceae bacterium]
MEAMLVWGLGLLAVAVLLFVVDIFVPTFGVLSITALAVAIAGVVCLFRVSPTWGLIGVLAVVVGGPALFFFGLNVMPHTPIGRRLVLGAPGNDDDAPPPAPDPLAEKIGSEAVVLTDLRPVGAVRIGDERFEALAETGLIRAGSKVRIVAIVDGTTLKVRPV